MVGGGTRLNSWLGGVPELGYRYRSGMTTVLPRAALRYPRVKDLWGQRVLR